MTQDAMILQHLQRGLPITALEALKLYSCLRLAGRIFDLRVAGYQIERNMIERNGKHFAEYRLRSQ